MVTQEQLEQLEKSIIKVYSDARFELTQKITKELADFAKEDKKKKKSLSKEDYKYWRRTQASRIAGMKELQNQLTQSVLNADKVAAELINGHLPIFYSEGFNYGTYQVEKLTNINTSFALYDKETVRRLLEDNPDLLPFVEIDETKTKRWSKAHINSAITQGVLQGESMDDIAKRLAHVVKMNENSAIRNARTATMGAENGGHLGSYQRAKDKGIEVKKRWSCTFDSRTRHSHVLMDGETIDIDKLFSNGVRYPADPEGRPDTVYNCRCTMTPELVRFPSDDSWKYEMDIDGMSYEEWKGRVKQNTDKSIEQSESIKKEIFGKAENSKFKGVARDAKNGTGSYRWKNSKAVPAETMRNMGEYSLFDRDGNTVVYGILDNKQVFYANKSDSKEIKELQEIYEKRKTKTYTKADDITIKPTSTYNRWKKKHDDNFAAWFGKDRLK